MRSWQNLSRGPGEVTDLFVDCRALATLAGLILVTRHNMRSVNGYHGSLEEPTVVRNSEADRARDKSIVSKRSVGEIANRVNGHGTATSLLWFLEELRPGVISSAIIRLERRTLRKSLFGLVFLLAVKHQTRANSPKTFQNGLRRGQTTKNTTRH